MTKLRNKFVGAVITDIKDKDTSSGRNSGDSAAVKTEVSIALSQLNFIQDI